MRYLALGDSYTIGEGVVPADRWPVRLADALRGEGIAVDAPRLIATSGWTTDELASAIDDAEPLGDWDLVSLLIGVNDQYRSRALDEFRAGFEGLLRRAVGFAGGRADRVLVLAIPDWGATAFGQASGRDQGVIAQELDAYNACVRDICATSGVAFVDIAPVSRALCPEAGMLVDDGLHPSAAVYAAWVDLALPVARGLLAR